MWGRDRGGDRQVGHVRPDDRSRPATFAGGPLGYPFDPGDRPMALWQRVRNLGIWPTTGMRDLGKGIGLAALVGVVAGLGGVGFHFLCHVVAQWGLGAMAGYHPGGVAGEVKVAQTFDAGFRPWMLIVVPALGGLVGGVLVYKLAPEAEGHGTDAAIDAYHNKRGSIRARVPIVKMFASAITLGTGGSGGQEGPIAQIGAGFGSFLAQKLNLSVAERRTLLAAGVGAGIGAIFRAPLAGAIFATEVLYRDPDFEAETLIPAFISTTLAYSTSGLFLGFNPLFTVAPMRFDNPLLLLPLVVLAVVMAAASLLYVKFFYGTHRFFEKLNVPRVVKPAIGGLATGLFSVGLYYGFGAWGTKAQADVLSVMAIGYGFLQDVMNLDVHSPILIGVLLAVGLGKIVTTSLTIGSGGSAGVFGPSMVIGGALGGVVGLVLHGWMPGVVTRVDVFVILGMASFFAAAANTPVSTLLIVSEMTGSYALLLPSMWVCALAYLISRGWSIFSEQVASRLESPAHRGDFIVDILQGLTVKDAIGSALTKFVTVPLGQPLNDIVHMITDTSQSCFPVVDGDGGYYGLFSLNDVRQFLYDSAFGELAVAQDLATTETRPLTLQTDLSSAIGRFASGRYEELPVVDADRPDRVIALLRRQDVIAAYSARLLAARREKQAGDTG